MNKKKFYFLYSLIFVTLFFFCFQIFLLKYHKSSLRVWDTFDMHYLEFLYLGRWVRTAITQFKFPVWDPSIGYGADFFLTMSGFICDPLNWIAVITPEKIAEYSFFLMVAFKLYLTGIAFSVLGFRRNLEPYAVLCGALVYSFSASAYTGLYQSGFINPMFALPLLIVGVDELFEGNHSVMYVLVLAYCAITSFYLTYMIAILIVLYCILKWIFREKELRSGRAFARIFARLVIYSVWAACLAAVVLVPMALLMLDMDRLDLQRYVPTLYNKGFYASLFKGFIETYDMQGRDCKIGFSVLALVCVFTMFMTGRGKNRQQKIEFLLMSVALCIPMVGHVMNGFGYVANRWVWAYALLVAYIVAVELPVLRKLDAGHWIGLILFSGVYVFLSYEIFEAGGRGFLILSIALLILCAMGFLLAQVEEKQYERYMVLITCITVFLPAFYHYSRRYRNEFGNNIEAGKALYLAKESGGLPLLEMVDTSDGSRYNRFGLDPVRNASWLYGVGGMDFYMNMYNNAVDRFHNSMAMDTYPWSFGYDSLDMRSELLALTGVNHFFVPAGSPMRPVGFDILEAEATGKEGPIQSWKPEKDHGIFSRFENAVDYKTFEALSPYSRQKLMMDAIVVAGGAENKVQDDAYELDSFVESFHGLTYAGSRVDVNEDSARMTLSIPEQTNSEVYVFFDNIQFENGLADGYVITAIGLKDGVPIENAENSYNALNNIHHMYGGKHDWMLNLGVVDEAINGIGIVFQTQGHYSMDGIHVYADSVDIIKENIAGLNQKVDSVRFDPNRVSLKVDSDKEEYLLAAIPYSDGWEAYDNGKRADILQADVAFMALKLTDGSHEISFVYHTPGLLAGFVISAVSLAGYIVYQKRLKRRAGVPA